MVKKNQHYVPQLYLRYFSLSSSLMQIGLFNIPNEIFKNSVSLKNQAKEDFFYDKDGFIEEQLAKIESLAAPCLKEIIDTNTLPPKNSEKYLNVLTFAMFLASRTKDAAEDVNSMADRMAKLLMSGHPDFKDKLDEYEVRHDHAATISLQTTAKVLPVTFDLELKLLINKSTQAFLTCDNPIVKFNQYLDKRKHPGGHLGFATKGLQIFFPISPKQTLIYFDSWAYKIGRRKSKVIEIDNTSDIDKLNTLQILNSYRNLYFNEDITEQYVRNKYNSVKQKWQNRAPNIEKKASLVDCEGKTREIYHYYQPKLYPNLELSFIKQTKKAKQHILSNFAAQLRDENLRNRL